MTITYISSNTKTEVNAGSGTAAGGVFTGAVQDRYLVVQASIFNSSETFTITSCTDGTNNYTVRSAVFTGLDTRQYEVVAYCKVSANGNYTPTFNLSGTNSGLTYAVIGVSEFSGIDTTTPEVTWDANNDIDITSADVSCGPITTTASTDLIVGTGGVVADSATSLAWASPTSWTNLFRQNDGFTSGTGHDSGYWLPGSVQTTYSPQWSHRNITGVEGAAVVVAFKAASGGSPIGAAAYYYSQL